MNLESEHYVELHGEIIDQDERYNMVIYQFADVFIFSRIIRPTGIFKKLKSHIQWRIQTLKMCSEFVLQCLKISR